jgi:hypothetical protein
MGCSLFEWFSLIAVLQSVHHGRSEHRPSVGGAVGGLQRGFAECIVDGRTVFTWKNIFSLSSPLQ